MSSFETAPPTAALPAERAWPDPLALAWWSAALLVAATALPAAEWADHLGLVPLTAALGVVLTVLLVRSTFSGRSALMLGLGYGAVVVLLQTTAVLDAGMAWRERAFDLWDRLAIFFQKVIDGEPSYDSLMFVVAMAVVFWAMAVFGTWWLFRRRGLWAALLLPGIAVFLNVYYYRFGSRLAIYLPIFLLALLALLARQELLRRRRTWEAARAQVPPDISSRITQAAVLAALALVVAAWAAPEFRGVPAEIEAQPEPASGLGEVFSDAFAGLRAPFSLYGDSFADSLALGTGRNPGSQAVFRARASQDVPAGARVYWRARTFDTYQGGGWSTAAGDTQGFRPRDGDLIRAAGAGRVDVEFLISPFVPALRLLYMPAQAIWLNRSADVLRLTDDGQNVDVLEAASAEVLVPGDSYRVRSRLAAPLAGDLRQAGEVYPAWVRSTYLQLPDDLPTSIPALAAEIAATADTPFDQAEAVTAWLRSNIDYRLVIEAPPPDRDPVEWFLFDSRVGFCDYYTSAAVLMLRSLGVPARMAAGYAAGVYESETGFYYVSAADSHSWPEVYFPAYGWVEFEPTVSQRALRRPLGDSGTAGGTGSDPALEGEDAADLGPADADELARLEALEDIDLPGPPAPTSPWPLALAAGMALSISLLLLRPVRLAVARAGMTLTARTGRPAPDWARRWSAPPATQAETVFRRLAAWPARLGASLPTNATAHERADALADLIPERSTEISEMLLAYTAERYGGKRRDGTDPRRHWRSIRFDLYRRMAGHIVARWLYGDEA